VPTDHDPTPAQPPRVALLVTCLVDLIRPRVGFASADLVERAGCEVHVPERQTCCGQPAYNSGDRKLAQKIARQVIETFEGYDYVVVPSGSCAGMVKAHFEGLFAQSPAWALRAQGLADKTYELTQFLVEVRHVGTIGHPFGGRVIYHDSCSGLRELGIKAHPRHLLGPVLDYSGSETCCGFGGTFAVKYPEISDRIVSQRVGELEAAEADILLGGDLGCLLNIAGKLQRDGSWVRVFHIAEVLAGIEGPAIGETLP
jgi:L-lactate dehydrogenase complex protein LldE